MLDELHVRNIALNEEAAIEFSPGLTVLTGETGAGKTALLSALSLVSGRRANADVVREGSPEAQVEGRFVTGEDELVISRRVSSKGRSRCSINGSLASVGELAQATSGLRIHGQHEQVQLLDAASQLSYLDGWAAEIAPALDAYREALDAYRKADAAYTSAQEERDSSARELEFMRFTVSEIEKVDPQEGEEERLEEDLPRLQHAEQLAQAVSGALGALQRDGAALDALADAQMQLSRESGIDGELDEIANRLDSASADLSDIARDLRDYADGIDHNSFRLQETLDRLDALSGLKRRFGPSMDQVFETWEQAKEALDAVEEGPERIHRLKEARDTTQAQLEKRARELASVRHEAAKRLCAELASSVHELAMEGAEFEYSFEELPLDRWTAAGPEKAELLYRPAEGVTARPLSRIASGGELSRILLALECTRYAGSAPEQGNDAWTLVFDEIDAGIGGKTGEAVACRLAELAQFVQVIVVTHLPQVAARANKHYVVVKDEGEGGIPSTLVFPVEGEGRVAEVARMLSGSTEHVALEHAAALIESGQVA